MYFLVVNHPNQGVVLGINDDDEYKLKLFDLETEAEDFAESNGFAVAYGYEVHSTNFE